VNVTAHSPDPEPQATPARQDSSLETRYRKLLEAAPDAILEVNPEGRITLTNQAAEKMFGYTRRS
jgi:PAS domain-containing protein